MNITITTDIIDILHKSNNLKLKHFYKSFKVITEEWINNYNIKGYCTYITKNNKFCLTKLDTRIDENKCYCNKHKEIIWKNESKIFNKISLNIFSHNINNKPLNISRSINIIQNDIKYEIEEEIPPLIESQINCKETLIEPSCPSYDEIYPPQKPNETGNIVKNILNNKGTYNIKLDNDKIKSISESIEKIGVKSITYYKQNVDFTKKELEVFSINNVITARNSKLLEIKDIKDNNGNILPIVNELLLNSDNNIITNIEDYKQKLENIDFDIYEYKGTNIQRLCRSTIELQFKLLLSKNSNTNIPGKLSKFINNIIKRIPK